MWVRSFVGLCVVGLAGVALWLVATRPPLHPNIVLIIGDDIDFSYYGFQGHELARTPSLDRLAQQGIVFDSGYATSSSCQPSLATLLAGVRWYTYERMAESIRAAYPKTRRRLESRYIPFTLPRLLRQVGYTSFVGGKMWEGSNQDAGFDAGTVTRARSVGVFGQETFGRESMQELYDFIDAQTGPWFAWVAPMLPHTPFDPPDDLVYAYADEWIPRSARYYFANLSRLDRRVGELMTFLDERELSRETVVIYLSDNGWEQRMERSNLVGGTLGEDRGKMSVHERGFRTPIIVRWPPEVRPGRRAGQIVTFEDVFETILDYAGAPSHECSKGSSFRHLAVSGDGAWERDDVLLRMGRVRYPLADVTASQRDDDPGNKLRRAGGQTGFYLREGDAWSYSAIPERGVEELYDRRADPMGMVDVSAEHPEVVERLRGRAVEWNARIEARRCAVVPVP